MLIKITSHVNFELRYIRHGISNSPPCIQVVICYGFKDDAHSNTDGPRDFLSNFEKNMHTKKTGAEIFSSLKVLFINGIFRVLTSNKWTFSALYFYHHINLNY